MHTAYRQELDRHNGIVEVDVRTAKSLTKQQTTRLEKVMTKVTGKTVRMNVHEDSELLGGLVVQVGSQVYDGSLSNQLDRFRDHLLGE